MNCEKIYYNEGYNVYIIIKGYNELPVVIYNGVQLKPYYRRTTAKYSYPMINIPNVGEKYIHRVVAFSVLSKSKYMIMKRKRPNETIVVDHINGNINDYRPSNLQYMYNSDNVKKRNGCDEKWMK